VSPRRRVALWALAALLVVTAGGAALRSALAGGGVAQDLAGTVLVVPGYGGDVGSVRPLAAALRGAGRTVMVVPPSGDGTGDLRVQAERLRRAADEALDAGAPSVDVVGYSAGGVVARVWAADADGAGDARRIVTLGSPHHGTSVASLGAVLAPDACPVGCQQLAEGSDLLRSLPETVPGPKWVSIWTSEDQTVTPPESARLAGATDIEVQEVCPDTRVGHGELPSDALVVALVERALRTQPLGAAPPPAECASLTAEGSRLLRAASS